MEFDRRKRDKLNEYPIGKYKKRHLKELSVDERRNIIDAYFKEFGPQADIARRFHES